MGVLAAITDQALGPLAALVLALLFIALFYKGLILPRNAVPREDYEAQRDISASQADAMRTMVTSMNELVATVRLLQKNGGGV